MTETHALGQLLAAADAERFDPYAERILEAARAQFLEFGMRRTSLDDIAEAAGVGRATLFRRFPHREALTMALAAREAQGAIASVDAQVAGIDDPLDFLVAGALAAIHEITGNALLQRLLVTDEHQMLPLLTGKGTLILTMGRLYMAAQLERLQAQGAVIVGDPEVISELLARLVLSIALNPDSILPLHDDAQFEQIVRTTIAPLILNADVADETEVAALVPGPGSMVWKYASDPRTLGAAGYALLLQIAHPTVAPAVHQLSNYKRDPFGRLLRSTDYLLVMTFGGPAAAAKTARTLREMHKRIRGVSDDGRRYSAFEPEAWAWVHATLGDAMITGVQNFARPMSVAERDRFYREWRTLGQLVQVRDGDLPFEWAEYEEYFDRMVAERLEDSITVQEFLEYIQRDGPSPFPQIPQHVWRLVGGPVGRLFWVATVGLLPPELRDRFGIRWSRAHQRQFRAITTASRAATPLMPAVDRVFSPEKALRWRREQIEREYLAPALGAG